VAVLFTVTVVVVPTANVAPLTTIEDALEAATCVYTESFPVLSSVAIWLSPITGLSLPITSPIVSNPKDAGEVVETEPAWLRAAAAATGELYVDIYNKPLLNEVTLTELEEILFALPYTSALAEDTDTRERTPAPSATTVASATRFVTVFVDMYFLSISRSSLS
jgi:hypothetical protein